MAQIRQTAVRFGVQDQAGWSAWVSVDGQPRRVHSVESGIKKSVAFIESQDGAEFKVHHRAGHMSSPPTAMLARVYLDGQKAGNAWLTDFGDDIASSRRTDPARTHDFVGVKISSTEMRPFVFGKPSLTENVDATAYQKPAIIKDLGTIQLRFWRVKVKSGRKHTRYSDGPREVVLSETATKAALSHQAKLGGITGYDETSNERGITEFIDPKHEPFHIVEFRYMSRELLELKGIVTQGKKRAIESITLSSDDDSDAADEAELHKVCVRLREIEKAELQEKRAELEEKKMERKRKRAKVGTVVKSEDAPVASGSGLQVSPVKAERS